MLESLVFLYRVQRYSSACLGCSESTASRALTGELARRPVTERSARRTTLIAFLSPCVDQMLCLLQFREPVRVQTLGEEGFFEAFHERIVRELSRPEEVDLHAIPIGP